LNNFKINGEWRLDLKGGPSHLGPGLASIYHLASAFCKGTGLDVGGSTFESDGSKGLPGSTVVDIAIPGSGSALRLKQEDGSQHYYFSSHCWEHLDDPEQAAREAYRVLDRNCIIFLYLPFPGNPDWDPKWSVEARKQHKWQPTPASVKRLLLLAGFEIDYVEHEQDALYSFVVMGRKP
jgi:SAM-dependent methyltransferase